MRYLVVSDIHSNLVALKAVLKKAKRIGYDKIICLGDFVGYYTRPNQVIELINEELAFAVLGNHDHGILHPQEIAFYFNDLAREALFYNIKILSKESLEFLKGLPLIQEWGEILFVHGTPSDPDDFRYIYSSTQAARELRLVPSKIIFVGHTHIPFIFSYDVEKDRISMHDTSVRFEEGRKYMINPGSVGQPRDGNPQASFGILDIEEGQYKNYRVEYNIDEVASEVVAAGLNPLLAERLYDGF
ncbi:MAG: metallophosphoesterase family protein [Candidatus Hydrothermia bacterium]